MWTQLTDGLTRRPFVFLAVVALITLVLGYWATKVGTDHRAGRFLSVDSQVQRDYERASALFGEGETVLYLVFPDQSPTDSVFLSKLDAFTQEVSGYVGLREVLSLTNIPYFVRTAQTIETAPLYSKALDAETLTSRIEQQAFLRGLLLSDDGETALMVFLIDRAFNNTKARIGLVDQIEQRARAAFGNVALAGFPYVRTQYAKRVTSEAPLFTLLAGVVSLLFLLLTFRAVRAGLLPTLVVGFGLLWTLGLMALFDHQLNIVTSVLPALLVIIGMANAIHLTTKFYDRYDALLDKRQAVYETVGTVGLTTFLACFTTAIGFLVLVFSGSSLLAVFGEYAAAGIMILYTLSIILIPIAFFLLKPPTARVRHVVTHDRFAAFFDRIAVFTQQHVKAILGLTSVLVVLGIVGATKISSDIFVFSDFYPNDPLRTNLAVFEETFEGVLPLEVLIASKQPGQFRALGNLRRIERLQTDLSSLPQAGRVHAITDFVKMGTQAYYGGNPTAYRLPASHEMPFLQQAFSTLLTPADGATGLQKLPPFIDSTRTTTRLLIGVRDIGTSAMNVLADTARHMAQRYFDPEQFEVVVTGTAITTTRSGENLVRNLIFSLLIALGVISVLMAFLFRSARLTLISLIPNMIPLLIVGAMMGVTGISLKPSTALIFPLSFGIAVDDTIHFLAKYRLLLRTGLSRDDAIRRTLRETGKAILFTSLILMSGFLVFTLSGFGGTVSLGALTALTLAVALLANLVLLPALLFQFAPASHTANQTD